MARALRSAMIVAVLLASNIARADVIDRVVALVSGTLIMQSDVTAAVDLGLADQFRGGAEREEQSATGGRDEASAALDALIERSLMLAEVERYAPPEPSAAAVDAELAAVRGRFASDADFEATLRRSGIDIGQVRGTIRQNLRIRAYLEQRFVVVPPTEQELNVFMAANPQRFVRGGATLSAEQAREVAVAVLNQQRRERLIAEWLAGLQRRADVRVFRDERSPLAAPGGR